MRRRWLAAALLAGALARAWALPHQGASDTLIWKVWSFAAASDVTSVYGVGGSPPEHRELVWFGSAATVDYPPLTAVELGAAGRLYRLWHRRFEPSRTLDVFVKLPDLLAEIAFVALLLTWGRRVLGEAAATWAAGAIWLNPALWLDGPLLGYLDPTAALPAAAALIVACAGPAWLAGALVVVAVLTKAQTVVMLPFVAAAVAWRVRGATEWRRAGAMAFGGTAVGLVALTPFIARGAWPNLQQAVGRLATHDMLSGQSANVWWILTWWLRVLDAVPVMGWLAGLRIETKILAISSAEAWGVPNARIVGTALVALAAAAGLWRLFRPLSSETTPAARVAVVAATAGWAAYAYAMWGAQVHENHLYFALPAFTLAAALDRRWRAPYWAVSAVFALNLFLFYGLGADVPVHVHRAWTFVDASVVVSFASLAVFVWTSRVLFRRSPATAGTRVG